MKKIEKSKNHLSKILNRSLQFNNLRTQAELQRRQAQKELFIKKHRIKNYITRIINTSRNCKDVFKALFDSHRSKSCLKNYRLQARIHRTPLEICGDVFGNKSLLMESAIQRVYRLGM